MKSSKWLAVSITAGILAVGAVAYKAIGKSTSVALTGAGYAGILAKDDKPVAAFAATGLRPHTFAGFTARTCGWICAASAKEALQKRRAEAERKA